MADTEEKKVSEEVTPEEEREQFISSLMEALNKFSNAPSEDQISGWKTEHGEIFASGFSEDEVYIWRPLTREEHRDSLRKLRETEQSTGVPVDEGVFKEDVTTTCLLWSSHPSMLQKKAGTIEMLFEQIMSRSNFMDPRLATQMVIKL